MHPMERKKTATSHGDGGMGHACPRELTLVKTMGSKWSWIWEVVAKAYQMTAGLVNNSFFSVSFFVKTH